MKFLLTRELGKLAKWLRILGFDTEYSCQDNNSSLIVWALRDERVILTRNHRLPQTRGVKIVIIKDELLKGQVKQVAQILGVQPDPQMMFRRCVICNAQLEGISKEKVKESVPEYVFNTQEEFTTCPKCSRIYWKGTHWGNVQKAIDEIYR